jgi:hypothetical protein
MSKIILRACSSKLGDAICGTEKTVTATAKQRSFDVMALFYFRPAI